MRQRCARLRHAMTDETLLQAFRATHYLVDLREGRVTLRVDEHSPALAAWMRAHRVSCAALLTAFNPGAVAHEEAHNHASQQQLLLWVRQRGHPLAAGHNEDPLGAWPPEPGVLAANVSQEEARAIARRFGQLACLWIDADAIPRLLWTAPR